MERITTETLEAFFQKLGTRITKPASFYLVGGSALILLGSTRETVDIDYSVKTSSRDFDSVLKILSDELRLDLESVPLQEYIPLPRDAKERHRFVRRYGNVDVYIFDPYSIALSKLDRGFDTDIDDILFLIKHEVITLPQLEQIVEDALSQARRFDISPRDLHNHLQAVRDAL